MNRDPKKSAMPCGCDPGCGEEGYLCERHRQEFNKELLKKWQKEMRRDSVLVDHAPAITAKESTALPITQDTEGVKTVGPQPGSPEWRKQRPLWSGVLRYFPDALLEVAYTSWKGNEQHNPGTELHWDRSKSKDEGDACLRHLAEAGKIDSDGVRHSAKAAWRALALLQKELEDENGKR